MVEVKLQEIAESVNKIKRLFLFTSLLWAFGGAKTSLQAMICKKLSGSGFPLQIRRSITTSHVNLITRGRQLGSPKVTSTRNGGHMGRSHGFTGNVCSPPLHGLNAADDLRSYSWIGEECPLVRRPSTGTF